MADRTVSVLGAVFGWLCLLYPARFRRLFRADMRVTFEAECLRVRLSAGLLSFAWFCARNFVAVVGAALAERAKMLLPGSDRSKARRRRRARSRSSWTASLAQDSRYALRGMMNSPAFTFTALVTVMIGVGATTTIFSVVNGVLLKPLPYPESERLVQIFLQNSPTNRWNLSVADYQAIEEERRSFASVAALVRGEATLTGHGEPEAIPVTYVTADFFRVLKTEPVEGRGFRPGEDRPGQALVVVISHAFRERIFGKNAHAVGETIELDHRIFAVIGIMPPGVRALGESRVTEVWPILQLDTPTRRGPFFIRGLAHLAEGASIDDATRDLAAISERIFPIWARGFTDETARLTPYPLRDVIIGDIGNGLVLLLGAVGLLLLIGIANVANLLLARATARAREMALRTSLGATRGRLASQLLVESLLLALFGGVLGVLISVLGVRTLVALGPPLPRLDQVAVDVRVAGFALAVTLASGIVFGLAPLVHVFSSDPAGALRSGEKGSTAAGAWGRLRSGIVAAEFALSLPLLVAAVTLLSSFARLARVDVGFDPDHLITARIPALPPAEYPDASARLAFWDEALRLIREIPEVETVGIGAGVPPDNPGTVVRTRGRSIDIAEKIRARIQSIDPGIPITNVQTMRDRLSLSIAQPRYWLSLVGLFAGVGLVLAAVGAYGVLSYYVSRQTREIGVRMALGADASRVRRMIVKRGIGAAIVGVGIGLSGSFVAARWLESLVFEISPRDPAIITAAAVVLLLVALGACYLPARRATNVDPVRALSVE